MVFGASFSLAISPGGDRRATNTQTHNSQFVCLIMAF